MLPAGAGPTRRVTYDDDNDDDDDDSDADDDDDDDQDGGMQGKAIVCKVFQFQHTHEGTASNIMILVELQITTT